MKSLRSAICSVFMVGVVVAAAPSGVVGAQSLKDNVCQGSSLSLRGGGGNCDNNAGKDKLDNLIKKIVNIFSVIVGIVAVIMIIFGGFKFITSGGDSARVGSAKNTIIYAIVGLLIVAFAQVIVRFIIGQT